MFFKKLRDICKYYEVEHTDGLYGRFGGIFKDRNTYIILARNPREAVYRLRKRGVSTGLFFNDEVATEKNARYKVIEVGKPKTNKHITYI